MRDVIDLAIRKRCPICGKPAAAKFVPFCSNRCANVDLHRWLNGAYALPAAERDEIDDDGHPLSEAVDEGKN
jgi:hypothetical protein